MSYSEPDSPTPKIVGTYISRSELGGENGTVNEITEKISRLAFEDVVLWITNVSMRFDARHRHTYQEQLGIAHEVLPESLQVALRERWRDPSKRDEVLFHRQQLWVVLQLALLCCRHDQSEHSPETDIRIFGECLLVANEVIGDQLTSRNRESSNSNTTEWFIANFLPLIELHWHSTVPVSPVRALRMWVEMPLEDWAKSAIGRILNGVSPSDAFEDRYHISLCDFVEFAVWIHFVFEAQNDQKKPLRMEGNILSLLGPPEKTDQCIELLARTREQMTANILFGPRQSWAVDFSPLRRHPLIRLSTNKYVCPDIQLLETYFDDCLYWLVVSSYPEMRNEIQQYYGELFERHIAQVIANFSNRSSLLAPELIEDPRFELTDSQVCDAALDWADTLALLECKATRLTRYQKYSGDADALLKGIDDAFAKDKSGDPKGVVQLARSISDILGGAKIRRAAVIGSRPIIPVLVVAEPGIAIEFIRRRLDDKMRCRLSAEYRDRVLPLMLLSVYDVEILEASLGAKSAEQVFRDYCRYVNNESPNLLDTFGSYLERTVDASVSQSQTYLEQLRYRQIQEMTIKYGFPVDLPNDESSPIA